MISALSNHQQPWQRRGMGVPAPSIEGANGGHSVPPHQFPVFLFCKAQLSNLRANLESPLAKCARAVRAKACRASLVTVTLRTHSGLEPKTPKFPVASSSGDHTALGVLVQANMLFQLLLWVSVLLWIRLRNLFYIWEGCGQSNLYNLV